MPRIMIFDGAPAAAQQAFASHGGPSNAVLFEQALAHHTAELDCFTVNVADGERLPQGMSVGDFDGVVITGSPLNVYNDEPAVTRQIELAREVLGSGVPTWGSCWGLQLATVALGGVVRLNPRGREIGIAGQEDTVGRHTHRLLETKGVDIIAFLRAGRMPAGGGGERAGMHEELRRAFPPTAVLVSPAAQHASRRNHQGDGLPVRGLMGVVQRQEPESVVMHHIIGGALQVVP